MALLGPEMGGLLMHLGASIDPRNKFAQGLLSYEAAQQQEQDRQLKRGLLSAQIGEATAQTRERELKAQREQRAMEQAARVQQAIPGLFGGAAGGGAPVGAGGAPGGMGGGVAGFDVQRALALGMDPKMIAEYAGLQNLGRSEVARTVEVDDGQGGKMTVQLDKFGRRVGEGMQGYIAPVAVNQGDRQTFIKPSAGVSLPMNMSPEAKASNAVAWANHGISAANLGLARQRLGMEQANAQQGKWQYDADRGVQVNLQTGEARPVVQGGAPIGPKKGEGALTEDQGKATGWLVQANNAWKNMQDAGLTGAGEVRSAATPGINDALEKLPVVGGLANVFRTADRQKFIQASESLSESLLRAATGAGVNREEAIQKVRELTPRFGEADSVTKQKFDAIPKYIESLKVRAGPGANRAMSIGGQPPTMPAGAPSVQSDPLGLRR